MNDVSIPEGFEPLEHVGPFLELYGPVYTKAEGRARVIGLRVAEKHLNTRGIVHGGMLVALADSALGINLSHAADPPRPMVTVNLSADFLEPGMPGDWLEAHVHVQRIGVHLAFASCDVRAGAKGVLRASGVFFILPDSGKPAPGKERFDG